MIPDLPLDRCSADERGGGAVTVPMAISVLALIAVLGLAVDGVRAAQGVARADAVAEEAARAAGQALDPDALSRGVASVDPGAASTAAMQYLTDAGAEGTVSFSAGDVVRIEVTLRRPTVVLGIVGRDEIVSHGSAEARLVPTDPAGDPG